MDIQPVPRSRLALITTSPYQVALFMRKHLESLPDEIEPVIFTNLRDPYARLVEDMDIRHVPLSRAPRLTPSDISAFQQLSHQLRASTFRSAITVSPKAGFVGQMAASKSRIRRRLHVFTGQIWEGMAPGPKRTAILTADRAIGRMATHLAADSESQARNLERSGVAPSGTVVTVPHAPGSIRGVDTNLFRHNSLLRSEIRRLYQLDRESVAFAHLGRISVAKGILELVESFKRLRLAWRSNNLPREPRLFLVGQDEAGLTHSLTGVDGIHILPFTERPQDLLNAVDVLVLASHREGFGSTIIEAAAMGIPAIGTDIVGLKDSIVPGETGWLVPPSSPVSLQAAMASAVRNPKDVLRRGEEAARRARAEFASDSVTLAWVKYLISVHKGDLS